MNKKLMTLGVAAAVGLAGFAALPVVAANTWLKKPGFENPKAVVVTVAGANKYLATAGANYGKSGIVTIDTDNVTLDLATLKEVLKGKKANKEGNPQDTAALAEGEDNWATPEVKAIDTIQLNGEFAKLAGTLKATATAIKTENTKDEYKNLKNINLAVSETAAELDVTALKDAVEMLKELTGVKLNIYTVSSVNKVKVGTDLTYDVVKDFEGRIAFNNGKNITAISATSPAKNLISALGLGENWKETVANYYEREGAFSGVDTTKPAINPEDKKDDEKKAEETKKAEEAAGNKTKAADKKGLKAPDTGIVK